MWIVNAVIARPSIPKAKGRKGYPMSQEEKYRRATVHWEDAFHRGGLTEKSDFEKELLRAFPMQTTGWIVAQTKDRLAMVTELDPEGDTRHGHSIPRKMITSIEYLVPARQSRAAKQ